MEEVKGVMENQGVLESVCRSFRSNSGAWASAKAEFDMVHEVPYYDLVSQDRDMADLKYVLSGVRNFLTDKVKGGMSAILSDLFVVDYELRCNIDKDPKYGVECLPIGTRVKWDKHDVRVKCVPGVSRDVLIPAELRSTIKEGKIRDLNKFAGMVGLNVDHVRNIEAGKAPKLLKVFQHGASGQNKLTRLVKGCLLFLDHLESGGKRYPDFGCQTVTYTVNRLVNTLTEQDVAYVYTNSDESHSTNAILHAMCDKYPHPMFGGCEHISIPADAKNIMLVGYDVDDMKREVYICAETIWGALIQYADQFRLESDLESALAIACSLRENRYFSTVELPSVISGCDLIFPAMGRLREGVTEKTYISSEAGVMLGRVHQMLSFVLFRDIDTSMYNTSIMKFNHDREIRSLLNRDKNVLVEYMSGKSCSDLLKITKQMSWMASLSNEDMARLRNISVLEGFWLLKFPGQVLKDGMIRCLKKGYKNDIGLMHPGLYFDSFELLSREAHLGSGKELDDIPNGGFNLKTSCLRAKIKHLEPLSFGYKSKMANEFTYYALSGLKKMAFEKPGVARCRSKLHGYRDGFEQGWELGTDGEEEVLGEEEEEDSSDEEVKQKPEDKKKTEEINVEDSEDEEEKELRKKFEDDMRERAAKRDADRKKKQEEIMKEQERKEAEEAESLKEAWRKAREKKEEERKVAEAEAEKAKEEEKKKEKDRLRAELEKKIKEAEDKPKPSWGKRPEEVLGEGEDDEEEDEEVLRARWVEAAELEELEMKSDLSSRSLLDLEKMSLESFCRKEHRYNVVCETWSNVLMCLPREKYREMQVGYFRTQGIEELVKYVDWSFALTGLRKEEFPPEYHRVIGEVFRAAEAKVEDKETFIDEEVLKTIEDERLREIVRDRLKLEIHSEEEFYGLKGIHSLLVGVRSWMFAAVKVFKLQEKRESCVTDDDLRWLAEYLDKGGKAESWSDIWKMAKRDKITRLMEWHKVSEMMEDIKREYSKLKKSLKARWPVEVARKKLEAGDSYSYGSPYMTRAEYNECVEEVVTMAVSKQALLLAQLSASGKFITNPQVYCIVLSNLEFKVGKGREIEERLVRQLREYLILNE